MSRYLSRNERTDQDPRDPRLIAKAHFLILAFDYIVHDFVKQREVNHGAFGEYVRRHHEKMHMLIRAGEGQ